MGKEVKDDPQLQSSIRAFLELGNLRNQLVHENFAVFPLEKTSGEIYQLYQVALFFVEIFPNKLYAYAQRVASEPSEEL